MKKIFKPENVRLDNQSGDINGPENYELVDINPENKKTEVPVLVAPGWGNTPKTLREVFQVISQKERRVLSLGHPREISIEAPDKEKYPLEELQKAQNLLNLIDKQQIEKTDAIGYSEGGLNVLIAAALAPEKFRNIVLVAPAGMIGKDSFLNLAGRFAKEIVRENAQAIFDSEKRRRLTVMSSELLKYIGQGFNQARKEVVAISKADIYQTLKELKEKGIGISVICGVDDEVIPMDKIQKQMAENIAAGKPASDFLDGFYSVKGHHQELILNPEKYADAAEAAISALEKKYNKKETQNV